MKDLIGKYITIKYRNRKEYISGFVIDSNEKWTLLKYNPVDYVIDGFMLIKSSNIKKYKRDKDDKFREKVLMEKGLGIKKNDKIPIENIHDTIEQINKKYGAIHVEFKQEGICHIGKLVKVKDKAITIREISPTAKWDTKEKYKLKDIQSFEFNTDYINSLLLYNRRNKD
jgi:hypothetical protein